jgi:chitin synthase
MYSENVTDTLHKKNLLLLGEDRYLTTLMLKTFPKRKLLFVPQAICKTIVPDEFRVLLSQRRRWINSTVHNLFELVLVPDLCGTFCCSMQFVVFMELCGTLVLPAAIVFTGVLIASTFLSSPQWIPLFLLAAILGLPALLILFTTRKLMYVIWFFVYIIALPIWNFVLPVYAFWHFDDFSWGQTRKIDGAATDDHGKAEGQFDSSQVFMKRWHEFEQERLIKSERWLAAGGRFASNSYVPVKSTVKEMEIVKDYNTSPVKPDYHGDPSTDVMPEQENNSGTKARGL